MGFLRYIVEETLAGRADRIKGYTIAVAVFGRDETFDAQADPVVRLEARRLRRDLDSYYVGAGSRDPVRISIPKGSYVPHFEWREAASYPTGRGAPDPPAEPYMAPAAPRSAVRANRTWLRPSRLMPGAALALSIVALSIAGWMLLSNESLPPVAAVPGEPGVMVLPFEAQGSTPHSQYLAAGLSHELITDLMHFPGFRLYTLPQGRGPDAEPLSSESWRAQGAAYIIDGSVRDDTDSVQVAARLLTGNGEVVWTTTYDKPLSPDALVQVQHELAGAIATAIGQPYGIVNSDLNLRLGSPDVSSMQSYVCVLRAFVYRRSFSREEHGPVLACLEAAVRRDPQYSDAWAMLGWLHLDTGRYEYAGLDNLQTEYEKALEAASRAVSLEPDNTLALKALSSIDHYLGRFEESERLARRAVALNPNDPDALAQLGWRLAVRGHYDEGLAHLRRAIHRTVDPPGWYYHMIAVHQCITGNYPEMLATARQSAADGSSLSQALIAIASAALDRREDTRDALEQMAQYEPLARDPAAYLSRHGATDEIVDALTAGLVRARNLAAQTN